MNLSNHIRKIESYIEKGLDKGFTLKYLKELLINNNHDPYLVTQATRNIVLRYIKINIEKGHSLKKIQKEMLLKGYDLDLIRATSLEAKEYQEKFKTKIIPVLLVISILALLGLGLIFLKPTITGFTIGETIAPSENITEIDKIINEVNIGIPKESIKDIRRIGFVAEEVTLHNKEKKTLIIHEPILPDSFENIAPLEEKDDFTYTSTLDNTRIEIEFDSEEIKQDIIGKKFKKDKLNKGNSWKMNYNLLLPSEEFKPKFKISSNSEIQVVDDYYGAIKTGQFELEFRAERENNFDIEVEQIEPNLVYVYLSQNYSEHGKNINDEILIDPSLTISNGVELCGEVTAYDTITIVNGGVLQICDRNATAGTGYVNISLGTNGNFTMYSGIIEGQGRGGRLGAGIATSGGTGTQGEDGETAKTGTASTAPNNGGGGGGYHSAVAEGAGGGGGGFGGAGGWGGVSATTQGKGLGGLSYSNSTSQELLMGSGGGGSAGDVSAGGADGGAGIKIDAGSGTIDIHGVINMSGNNGTNAPNNVDDAGGGGGSGGHVILIADTINLSYGQILAEGGWGGNAAAQTDSCAGGGAGGGRIVYVYKTIEDVNLINSTQEGGTDWSGVGDNACDGSADAGNSSFGAVGSVYYGLINTAPTTPDLNLPANNTNFVNVFTIELNWSNASDLNNDAITYYLEIWNESAMTNLLYVNSSISETTNTTSDLVTFPSESNDYFWRVIANDETDNSSWSELRNISFSYLITNTAPNNPTGVLFNSSDLAQTNRTSENLTANFLCDDPDAVDVLTYIIDWFETGVNQTTQRSVNSCSDPEYIGHYFDAANTSKDQNWSFEVTVCDDSDACSSVVASQNLTIENSLPNLTFVSLNETSVADNGFNIIEGGRRFIEISFIAGDVDDDLDNTTAKVNISSVDKSVTFSNTSCGIPTTIQTGQINYTCTVLLEYFNPAGDWHVAAEITDLTGPGNSTQNSSILPDTAAEYGSSWFVSSLTGMNLTPTSLTFPSVTADIYNITSNNDPFKIENTGNQNKLDVFVEGITLFDDNVATEAGGTSIPAENFTVSPNTGGTCSGAECTECQSSSYVGTALVNNTATNITGVSLIRGQGNLTDIYFCLFHVPLNISLGNYSTGKGTSAEDEEDWTVSVAP